MDIHIVKGYKMTIIKASKGAKIKNRYNQVPYLTQDQSLLN